MLPLFISSAILLSLSVALGGATSSGYMADVAIQLASVPCLIVAVGGFIDARGTLPRMAWTQSCVLERAATCLAVLFSGLLVILAVRQLTSWLGGPGLDGVLAKLHSGSIRAGISLPVPDTGSIAPIDSAAALAGLLPALAMLTLVVQLDTRRRISLIGLFILLGLVSLALGVIQVAQGPEHSVRLQAVANRHEATGFFANRNHFAALAYCTLTMGVAWFVCSGKIDMRRLRLEPLHLVWLAALAGFMVLVLAGVALARSRAGIMLTLFALLIGVATLPRVRQLVTGQAHSISRTLVLGSVLCIVLLAGIGSLGAGRFLERFQRGLSDSTRQIVNQVTAQAAWDAFPAGVGLGSFPRVFAVYEPWGILDGFLYMNRAHNDWIEFLLEAGAIGAALMLTFLVWFAIRVVIVWHRMSVGARQRSATSSSGAFGADLTSGSPPSWHAVVLSLFASLAISLLLVHSSVDYPLRTSALGVCFAMFCGLLTSPPRGSACP